MLEPALIATHSATHYHRTCPSAAGMAAAPTRPHTASPSLMNEADRREYRERYVRRLREYGHDERSLGWSSGKQHQRFAALTGFVPLTAISSVLDVGCGFGDLFPFLRAGGFTGQYVGIDFIPELIETGRAAYPDADLRVAELSEVRHAEAFDLVVASGLFNARLSHDDNWTNLTSTLRLMHGCARVAAAADFLSSHVDFTRADLSYTSPEDVFAFAKTLTRRVALSHHYLPFEFAICLYRDDEVLAGAQFRPLPLSSSM